MITFLTVFVLNNPTADSRWQVPFFPVQQAALNALDQVFFATNDELYVYDVAGNLIARREEKTHPKLAFSDQLQQFYVYDAYGVMHCYSPDLNVMWSRVLPKPTSQPFIFRRHLAIPTDDLVALLNPETGELERGIYVDSGIESLQRLGTSLLISGKDRINRIWDNHLVGWSDQGTQRFGARSLVFVTRGPDQSLAVIYSDRSLHLYRADWSDLWERQFVVDVELMPIWLGTPKKPILAIASQARDVRIFAKSGRELWRVNLRDRPGALIRWDAQSLIVTQLESPELIWLDLEKREKHIQPLSSHVTHVLQNQNTVLFIGYDGYITSYAMNGATVMAASSE